MTETKNKVSKIWFVLVDTDLTFGSNGDYEWLTSKNIQGTGDDQMAKYTISGQMVIGSLFFDLLNDGINKVRSRFVYMASYVGYSQVITNKKIQYMVEKENIID